MNFSSLRMTTSYCPPSSVLSKKTITPAWRSCSTWPTSTWTRPTSTGRAGYTSRLASADWTCCGCCEVTGQTWPPSTSRGTTPSTGPPDRDTVGSSSTWWIRVWRSTNRTRSVAVQTFALISFFFLFLVIFYFHFFARMYSWARLVSTLVVNMVILRSFSI